MSEKSDECIEIIGRVLAAKTLPMRDRFRALFTLKNLGGKVAIVEIAKCFVDDSCLLKHELAYCLGQMRDEFAIPYLIEVLKDEEQEPMVRHEAGIKTSIVGTLIFASATSKMSERQKKKSPGYACAKH